MGATCEALRGVKLLLKAQLQLAPCCNDVCCRRQRVHVLEIWTKRRYVDVARQGVIRAPQQQVHLVHGLQLLGATPAKQAQAKQAKAQVSLQLGSRDSGVRGACNHLQHRAAVVRGPGGALPGAGAEAFRDVGRCSLHDGSIRGLPAPKCGSIARADVQKPGVTPAYLVYAIPRAASIWRHATEPGQHMLQEKVASCISRQVTDDDWPAKGRLYRACGDG